METKGNPMIARLAGALAALAVTLVLGWTGLEVTDEQKAGVVGWLTEGLTALGGFVMLVVYSGVHRWLSRRLNPADVAAPGYAQAVDLDELAQRAATMAASRLRADARREEPRGEA